MSALLLCATPAVPMLLLAAMAGRALRPAILRVLWAAPLPALACAWLAGDAGPFVFYGRARLTLALDAPSALLLGAAALLWCAGSLYAQTYVSREALPRFAAWWLATMAGSLGVFVADDLVSFYLVYALASLPAWGLVIHDRSRRAWSAGATYILLTVIGEAALLAAFALLAATAPGESLAISDVLPPLAQAKLRDVTIALLILGFGLKAGLVPLHVWLPLAHPVAPMPASAVLSGAIIKAGVIGLIRFLPVDVTPPAWGTLLAGVGFLTAFWGVGVGIAQRNPKTVLAYSSISQMGVVAAAIGMGLAQGMAATGLSAAFYAVHHVLAKGALFLAVGVAAASGGRSRLLVSAPALLLALGFGGLPMTGGWLAKEAVKPELGGHLAGGLAWLSAVGSTVLMLHFVRRLSAACPEDAAARPQRPLLLIWWAMAIAAVAGPWLLFPAAGGSFGAVLTAGGMAKALPPVLLGILLSVLLAGIGDRMWRIPEGDILVAGRRALGWLSPVAPALGRAEAALRVWPTAGLTLLLITLLLGLALGAP